MTVSLHIFFWEASVFLFLEVGKSNRHECKVTVNRDFIETVILPASINQLVETVILERSSWLMNIKKF